MSDTVRRYRGESIEVTYDTRRCIHAAECVRGLPGVFNTQRRPWIQPEGADADAVAEVVTRCPSGALHYTRTDSGAPESAPDQNTVVPSPKGPLYLRGALRVQAPDGTTLLGDTRIALCRCGQSENKPLCDNSHQKAGFADAGGVSSSAAEVGAEPGELTITPTAGGPLLLRGPFKLVSADGQTVVRGTKAALCRCGGSGNKPFCDGTHAKLGFTG